ncbi:MAG: methyltransferase [Chloroflexi bacterium]|nr:methyltransferase [Chloroflexota bacterium]
MDDADKALLTAPMNDLQLFINKRVKFRYFRRELAFDLSQSLFSSFDVDLGSRLLLKTIAKEVALDEIGSVLDVGCGVGVLGISLKKVNPTIALTVQDRDALALAFTQHNAALNEIAAMDTPGGLALQNLGDRQFDLIMSNLPGKAGAPVLADMLARMPRHLTEAGRAAVVIVKPLVDFVAQTLREMGSDILLKEAGRGHTVFHFRGGGTAVPPKTTAHTLAPYIRARQQFRTPPIAYRLQTVYNLPEFDTLGFQTAAAFDILKNQRVNGRVLIWNPGQGHTAVYLCKQFQSQIIEYVLGGRDLLSLTISRQNLQEQGIPATKITTFWRPDIRDATGQFDFILLFPDNDPGVSWQRGLLADRLAPGGQAILAAKSGFIQRLLPLCDQLTIRQNKKRRGYRAVLFDA